MIKLEEVKDLFSAKVVFAAPLPNEIPAVEELFKVTSPFTVFVPANATSTTAPPVEELFIVTLPLNVSPVVLANRILAVFVDMLEMVIVPEPLPKVFPPVQSL